MTPEAALAPGNQWPWRVLRFTGEIEAVSNRLPRRRQDALSRPKLQKSFTAGTPRTAATQPFPLSAPLKGDCSAPHHPKIFRA